MRRLVSVLIALAATAAASAFDGGWVLNMKGGVGGSLTIPSISDSDLGKMGANKMEGMLGFVGGGKAEVGYIFDSPTWFNLPEDHAFSGAGAFGYIGVGSGYAGQISGSYVDPNKIPGDGDEKQVDVFVNVHYTPVISLGATGKAYFFDSRLAVGLSVGMKMIADAAPEYEIYSTDPETIPAEVGTIIVDDWMMKNMNPFMASFELLVEYNIPVLPTTELILGGNIQFNIFSPKYLTMPDSVMGMAVTNFGFDPKSEVKSYFINSLDFGLTVGLGFRL